MLNIQKNKTFLTVIIASLIIVLGLLGSRWQIGFAEDDPTIPTIPNFFSITPDSICAGSGDTQATIRGANFIDEEYTWVRWLDADNNFYFIVPDFVSADGTQIDFTIDAAKLDQVWIANIWIVNHPPALDEMVGTLSVEIVACNFIYLPLVMK